MAISKNVVAGGITALGGTGAVAGVIIANQNKGTTIKEELGIYLIKETNDFTKRWELKETSETLEGVGDGTEKKTLETWCKKQYDVVITDEVRKENGLLSQVKKWCTFTIKQKLGNEALNVVENSGTENPDKADWEIKTQNLKDYEDPETNKPFNIEDIKETKKSIEEATGSTTDIWKKLRQWCEGIYKLNHLENTNNKLELARKFCTKATIGDALHGTELSEEKTFEEDWTKKVTDAISDTGNSGIKDSNFKQTLKGINGDNADKEKREKLQEWCRGKYSKHHKVQDKWGGSSLENVLVEVKKWCALTIKEKLDTHTDTKKKAIADTNDDTSLENNIKALNNYTKETNGPELTTKLKSLQNAGNGEDTSKKEELKNWCKGIWNKGYKADNLYKLADKFCRKSEA